MITEFRRLVFSPDELAKAITAFRKLNVKEIPEGEVIGIEVTAEQDIGAKVRVKGSGATAKEHHAVVDAEYLGAAMLFHCKRNKIPLPRAPQKTLERTGDGLALSFSINAALEPGVPPNPGPNKSRYKPVGNRDTKPEPGKVVLVVEDDPEVRTFAVTALERLGYRTIAAADATEAMEVLETGENDPDLLLSDVVLPGGVSGPQFAVKAKERCPQLKIVFMTGYAPDPDTDNDISKIGECLLWKPFKRADLAQAIKVALTA